MPLMRRTTTAPRASVQDVVRIVGRRVAFLLLMLVLLVVVHQVVTAVYSNANGEGKLVNTAEDGREEYAAAAAAAAAAAVAAGVEGEQGARDAAAAETDLGNQAAAAGIQTSNDFPRRRRGVRRDDGEGALVKPGRLAKPSPTFTSSCDASIPGVSKADVELKYDFLDSVAVLFSALLIVPQHVQLLKLSMYTHDPATDRLSRGLYSSRVSLTPILQLEWLSGVVAKAKAKESAVTAVIVGGRFGFIPLFLASLGVRVHTFDFVPSNIELLRCNIAVNSLDLQNNIVVNEFGLLDKDYDNVCLVRACNLMITVHTAFRKLYWARSVPIGSRLPSKGEGTCARVSSASLRQPSTPTGRRRSGAHGQRFSSLIWTAWYQTAFIFRLWQTVLVFSQEDLTIACGTQFLANESPEYIGVLTTGRADTTIAKAQANSKQERPAIVEQLKTLGYMLQPPERTNIIAGGRMESLLNAQFLVFSRQ